jgi:hypothetical protein
MVHFQAHLVAQQQQLLHQRNKGGQLQQGLKLDLLQSLLL